MPDRWYTTARALLDALVAGYEDAGVKLPLRRYVAPAQPAVDCDQVTVHLLRTYSYDGRVTEEVNAPGGDRPLETLGLRAAVFIVTVIRKVPTITDGGSPPSPTAEEGAAALVLADAELLPAILAAMSTYNDRSVGGWVTVPAQGGYAGGMIQVTIGV